VERLYQRERYIAVGCVERRMRLSKGGQKE